MKFLSSKQCLRAGCAILLFDIAIFLAIRFLFSKSISKPYHDVILYIWLVLLLGSIALLFLSLFIASKQRMQENRLIGEQKKGPKLLLLGAVMFLLVIGLLMLLLFLPIYQNGSIGEQIRFKIFQIGFGLSAVGFVLLLAGLFFALIERRKAPRKAWYER